MFKVFYLGKIPYLKALYLQQDLVLKIKEGIAKDYLLFAEHPPTITLGRSFKESSLLFKKEYYLAKGIDVIEVDRGGDVTYHGFGQLVIYPIFSLNMSPHLYLRKLEEVIILTLKEYNIAATRKKDYTGVWVNAKKIAAIGVKFNKKPSKKFFITSHGIALNVNTDLEFFKLIIPCGIKEFGVTSLKELTGSYFSLEEVAKNIEAKFRILFA